MAGDDWLEIDAPEKLNLPAVLDIPMDYVQRIALAQSCWAQLSPKQHMFLLAWRENRMKVSKAAQMAGVERHAHMRWMSDPNYATVVRIWTGSAADAAVDRDRLLARQDNIVEELLTPKPILHQGAPTGFKEVNATGAARANETLMKAAGLLKDKEVDVNVGLVGPSLTIQVVQPDGNVIDATPVGVSVELPEPESL